MLDAYDREIRAYKEEALKMSWYMRGGLSYDDAMLLSYQERKAVGELIKENLETTKKSGQPFFQVKVWHKSHMWYSYPLDKFQKRRYISIVC